MNTRSIINMLMHNALVEIRAQNVERDPMTFHLADLFHNIPLQLENVAEGRTTSEEVLEWLKERAQQNGEASVQWLQSTLEGVYIELNSIDDKSSDVSDMNDNT